MKELKKGENKITWNGQDERGQALPAGDYQLFLEAVNSSGTKMNVKTEFEGTITGVNYTPEGPVLLVGNQTVKIKDVEENCRPKSYEERPEKQIMYQHRT